MTCDDWLKIVLGFSALGVTTTGWFVTYRHSRETQLRKDRLDLVNRQLSDLYGPLFISCVAGRTAYRELLAKLGLPEESSVFGRDGTPSAEMVDEWVLWMEHVFLPLNELREKIVLEKLYLLRESDRQRTMPVLEQLVAHVSSCRAMVAKWKRDKDKVGFRPSELYPQIEFPRHLEGPLGRAVSELQEEQATLLQLLEPKTTRGFTRLDIFRR